MQATEILFSLGGRLVSYVLDYLYCYKHNYVKSDKSIIYNRVWMLQQMRSIASKNMER